MCGVPVHAADPHIKRLAELGYRVAICEQVEDPRAVSGRRLVKRQVIEVVTPGLVGDPEGLEAASELALVALDPGDPFGIAVLDASTGDFRATEVARVAGEEGLPSRVAEELQRVDPREVLLPEAATASIGRSVETLLPSAALTRVAASGYESVRTPVPAASALLAYLEANQPHALAYTSRLRRYELSDAMVLDAATRIHLELFRNNEDGSRARTLVERLDQTATPLGARRLARWIAYPAIDPDTIHARQDAVAWLADRDRLRARLRVSLRPVRDLERLLARAARPTAMPRDLGALRASLEAVPEVVAELESVDEERLASDDAVRPAVLASPCPVPAVANLLREALVDEPPAIARGSRGAGETGYVRRGFHAELDGLREAVSKGREWIVGLEARERERTGIQTLKIRFHPVHGYAIEVSKANLSRAPEDYERVQTLANAERFTTPELREMEQNIVGANDRAAALERELFESVRLQSLEHADAMRAAAEAVANVDVLASLAEVARRDGWTRPDVDDGDALEIHAGRHPVVEPLLAARGDGEFVPNDTHLDPAEVQILVLTGPNMSGKSTYLRQVALIVLLAQMGSFVPAESARVGVVDRVFTRVGATDRLARGESTFMVEMREMAEILAQASPRSLIILDEIGRGTSTFDGLSIAWAVAEYLHDTPGLRARTLFATHYHELTDLARTKSRVRNAHFTAREWGDDIVFLRRLVPGGANRSYGIQVARLAGLPGAVIARAREILDNLEGGEFDEMGRPRLAGAGATVAPDGDQLALFRSAGAPGPEVTRILEDLRRVNPDETTPREALEILAALCARLPGGQGGEGDA